MEAVMMPVVDSLHKQKMISHKILTLKEKIKFFFQAGTGHVQQFFMVFFKETDERFYCLA